MMLQSTPSFVAMAALSSLREREETTRPTSRYSLERFGFATQNNFAMCNVAMLRSCSSCCCGAATRSAAVLQAATLRRYGAATINNTATHNVAVLHGLLRRCGATQVITTLRRGSRSRCCDSAALQQLGCCDSAALQQLAMLRRCGAAAARGAETLRC